MKAGGWRLGPQGSEASEVIINGRRMRGQGEPCHSGDLEPGLCPSGMHDPIASYLCRWYPRGNPCVEDNLEWVQQDRMWGLPFLKHWGKWTDWWEGRQDPIMPTSKAALGPAPGWKTRISSKSTRGREIYRGSLALAFAWALALWPAHHSPTRPLSDT